MTGLLSELITFVPVIIKHHSKLDMRHLNKLSLLLAAVLAGTVAQAQNPAASALGFNVFVRDSAILTNNETQGPVAIGANLALNNVSYQVATNTAGTFQVGGDNIGLLVGGRVRYNSGNALQINNNGYVKIGDSTGSYTWYVDQNNAFSPIQVTPGATYNGTPRIQLQANAQQLGVWNGVNPVFQGGLVNFATAFNTLAGNATIMQALPNNVQLTDANGNNIPSTNPPATVKMTLNNGLNVLNITGADMNQIQNFTFNNTPNSNRWLLVNVDAQGTFNWNVFNSAGIGGNTDGQFILYNFYNTTVLNLVGSGAVVGSIFAPSAHINKTVNSNNVHGQVIGRTLNHTVGMIQYAPFQPNNIGSPALAVNFENGLAIDNANCWQFPGAVSSSTVISGNNTFRTSSLTGGITQTAGVRSPWINFNSTGSIKCKVRMESWGGASWRQFKVYREDASNPTGSGWSSGVVDTLIKIDFSSATSTNVVNVDIPITFSGPHRIFFFFYGGGGNSRGLIDDITINGTYYADPANFCLPLSFSTPTDANFTVNDSTQCINGNSFVFNNTSTGVGLTYAWDFGDATTSTATSPTKTYTTPGTYTVRLIATGSNNVKDTATRQVTVGNAGVQPGAFTASNATVYRGQTSVTYTVPAPAAGTLTWSYSGTGATITGSGNSVTVDFAPNATSGILSVTNTVSAICGASSPRSINITVKPYLIWTCGASNDWNNPANWDGNFVPYNTISVLIPSGLCKPNVTTGNPQVRTMILNNNEVQIACPAGLSIVDSLVINGTVTGCGYLTLNGPAAQQVSGQGTVDNLEVNKNTGSVTITAGDNIRIRNTYKPTSGSLITNNGLELLSDSLGTATILSNILACNYIQGNVTVNKWIGGGRRAFRFFGHPFSQSIGLNQLTPYIHITGQGGAANGFTTTPTNNPSAFWYNTALGTGSATNDTGWRAYTNTDGQGANAWRPKEGARIFVRGTLADGICCNVPNPVTLRMTGPVNQCDIIDTLQTNANFGYNFVGNPYASNVNMSGLQRGSNIGANFSVWDPRQGTAGAYVSQPFAFSYILPAYSAFITTCTGATNNTITFPENSKTAAAPTNTLFKTTTGTFGSNVIQMRIMSNNDSVSWDRLLLFFDGAAASTVDPLDGRKLSNPNLDFYTFSTDNEKLAIDFRPFVDSQVIPLGLNTDILQDYTIKVEDFDIPANKMVLLHDKFLNVVQPLSGGMQYNFTVSNNPASFGDARFELNLSEVPTNVSGVASAAFRLNMMPNPATRVVNINWNVASSTETEVTIATAMGQVVYNTTVRQGANGLSVPVDGLSQGMYFVTVKTNGASVTQKLIKQ